MKYVGHQSLSPAPFVKSMSERIGNEGVLYNPRPCDFFSKTKGKNSKGETLQNIQEEPTKGKVFKMKWEWLEVGMNSSKKGIMKFPTFGEEELKNSIISKVHS